MLRILTNYGREHAKTGNTLIGQVMGQRRSWILVGQKGSGWTCFLLVSFLWQMKLRWCILILKCENTSRCVQFTEPLISLASIVY